MLRSIGPRKSDHSHAKGRVMMSYFSSSVTRRQHEETPEELESAQQDFEHNCD